MAGGWDIQGTPLPGRTMTFEPAPSAAPAARRFVRKTSQSCDTQDLDLLVPEVASIAVFHARSAFTVRVIPLTGGARVEVGDHDSRPPQPLALDPSRANGRWMLIHEVLARSRWRDRCSCRPSTCKRYEVDARTWRLLVGSHVSVGNSPR
jgi:hypothetical protein